MLLQLFWSFFQIGLFSIGGGMASIPLIQEQIVDLHQWLSLTEFTDLITIAEMTPGPIAINSATFVGIRVAGFPGALVATFASILPSLVIVSFLAWVFYRFRGVAVLQGILAGLRPAVVALIASAGLSIIILAIWGEEGFSLRPEAINVVSLILFVTALFILQKWKPNPIVVMLATGVIGGTLYLIL